MARYKFSVVTPTEWKRACRVYLALYSTNETLAHDFVNMIIPEHQKNYQRERLLCHVLLLNDGKVPSEQEIEEILKAGRLN